MNRIKHFTEEDKKNILRAIKVAWPAVMESFFVAMVSIIDSFMVSQIGSYAVAAIGLTIQPKFIGLAIFFAINTAVSATVARRKGEEDRKSANEVLITSMATCLVLTIIISLVIVILANPIIYIVGSESDTHTEAVTYLRIIMGCMLFNVLSLVINAAQRGSGNTKIALTTNLVSNTVNVVFNYLLIGGELGFPKWGVSGAAIATVLGTVAGCSMSIASLFRKDSYVSIPYMIDKIIKPRWDVLRSMTAFISNVFVEQIMLRVGFLLASMLTAKLGTQSLAINQVGMNLMTLSFAFGDGLQVAAITLIGQSLGQRKPENAIKYGKICQGIGLGISIILGIIYMAAGKWYYNMYFPEDVESVRIGYHLCLLAIIAILFQISQVVYTGSLRAAGDVRFTTIVSTISVAIVRPIIGFLLAYVLGFGIYGIWIGMLVDQFIRLVSNACRFRSGKWMNIKD